MVRGIFGQHGAIGSGGGNTRLTSSEAVAFVTGLTVKGTTPESVIRKIAKVPEDQRLSQKTIASVQASINGQLNLVRENLPEAPPGTAAKQGEFYSNWLAGDSPEAMAIKEHPKLIFYRGNPEMGPPG